MDFRTKHALRNRVIAGLTWSYSLSGFLLGQMIIKMLKKERFGHWLMDHYSYVERSWPMGDYYSVMDFNIMWLLPFAFTFDLLIRKNCRDGLQDLIVWLKHALKHGVKIEL